MRRAILGWAAERQADILLYVGAFLLSVAAIIFVAYQGDAVAGEVRFAILTAYAAAFLGFGVALHRWDRVKEAGPTFLALGAILVPIDFVMLRTQVLSEGQVPTDVLVFVGAASSAALYFALAARGYGRWYAVPGVPAALLAWGALGSILNFQAEWYGPWFVAIAAPLYVLGLRLAGRWSAARALTPLAASIAVTAIAWTHGAVLANDAGSAALPISYLVTTSAVAAGLGVRRTVTGFAALPSLAALTAATAWWSAFGLELEWQGVFALLAGIGYLVVAHFDEDGRAPAWAAAAAAAGAIGLIQAHATVLIDPDRAALPATYLLAFAGAGAAFGRWRWAAAGALMPPLGAITLLTGTWASTWGLALDWYGAFAALASMGYLVLAFFDRQERREAWRVSALAASGLALALAHTLTIAEPSHPTWALPATYGLVLAAAAAGFARWRFGWRPAPGALPALAVMVPVTAISVAWDAGPEWFGVAGAPAAAGYIVLSFMDRDPRWRRMWVDLALGVGGFALLFMHAVCGGAEVDAAALPLVYMELLAAAVLAVARWRLAYREVVLVVPLLAAGLAASLLWAAIDMPLEWLSAWTAAAAAGYSFLAVIDPAQRWRWRITAALATALAISAGHGAALAPDTVPWQLPLTYTLLIAGWTVDAVRTRGVSILVLPVLAAFAGAAALWAAGAGPEWWPYPALAVAAAIVLTQRLWAWSAALERAGWAYAVLLAAGATLAFLRVHYSHPAHGAAVQLITAALVGVAAFASRGAIGRALGARATPAYLQLEESVLLQVAYAFIFGAAASLNAVFGLSGSDRAWLPAGLAIVAWAVAAFRWQRFDPLWTFVPVGLAGTTLSLILAADSPGALTAALALATLGPLLTWVGQRRWILLGIANSYLMLLVGAAWEWQDANIVLLPLGFAALGIVEWAAFLRLRRYTWAVSEAQLVMAYLSWGPWLVASAVAGLLMAREQEDLRPGVSIVTTAEWALAAAVLALASAAVVAEGLRLRMDWVWRAGSVGLLVALLMAVATFEPANVQAYTAPIGCYLIAVALTFRRSPELLGENLLLHEAVMAIGAAFLVLPPAEQSFEPGGGKFGLELIGIGTALLLVGLLLHARWLVAAAVLTLTGVSIRMVTGGFVSAPYWLLLGVAGSTLIGFGLLVLLERERWDRFRLEVLRWWQDVQMPPVPPGSASL